MPALLETVLRTTKKYGMLSPGDRVVASVSGGPDSVAMLHALHALSGGLDLKLAVAHLDHGLRPESEAEADFVRRMADGLGLPFFTEKARLKEMLLAEPENKQAAARRVRYAFLERVRKEFQAQKVSVGHTADDQAETWLMRQLRGSGSRGLSAIPPVRGAVIRPLLEATREQVMAYLSENGIPYVTDPSNLRPDYLRNRLRLELLPLLKKYNPEVIKALCRSAEILQTEDSFMDEYARESFARLTRDTREGCIALDRGGFCALHPAIRRRVLRQAVERVKGGLMGIDYSHIMDAVKLITTGGEGGGQKGLDLPGRIRIETSYNDLIIRLKLARLEYEIELPVPGRVGVPESGMLIEAALAPAGTDEGSHTARFDARCVRSPLVVRNRRPGDAFYPEGMQGRKKLQDYFVDKKIPREQRDRLPLLVSGGEILWVIGMRRDRRRLAGPETKETVLIRVSPS